jgi:hypothetical protein
MAFICWAWRDSLRCRSGFDIRHLGFFNTEGGVFLIRDPARPQEFSDPTRVPFTPDCAAMLSPYPSPHWLRGESLVWDLEPVDLGKAGTRLEMARKGFKNVSPEYWSRLHPDRLLLHAVAMLWAGQLLLRRARRRKRAVEAGS